METYEFSESFELGGMLVTPVHLRVERLQPIIAAHMHSNTSYEIHYTASGSGSVTINGAPHRVSGSTLYITGPGIEHAQISDLPDPVIEYCLYLDCRRVRRDASDPFALFTETTFWMGSDDGSILSLLNELLEEQRSLRPGYREMSHALLVQIIICLTRLYRMGLPRAEARESAPQLNRVGLMPVIEDAFFYRYRTLTLKELSELLNLSVRQTQRLLNQNFGKSFSRKLTEARMAAATQFLTNTDMSITELSDRLGFSSIEHFSSAFRRSIGMSPTAYRKLHSGKAMEASDC